MSATDERKKVRAAYSEIIGRNVYSQSKRSYCFSPYPGTKTYYSDCSSSVSLSYKKAGHSFGLLNTVGMYNEIGKKFTKVPVVIEKGQIKNPEILRIGDMLLYRGTNGSRPQAVGHVEMYWGYDSKGVHWLYGHGSGKPKKTKMVDKNKSRYNSKTSTKWGNKGLFAVARFIQDDDAVEPDNTPAHTSAHESTTGGKLTVINTGKYFLRVGPGTEYDSCGIVSGGSHCEIVAELVGNPDWFFVCCEGKVGFIGKSGVKL